MTRVVCALSGGGAKTAAHLGAVKALTERSLTPDHYVGTSMGAVIAACLASGLSYEQSLVRMTQVRRADVAALSSAAVLGYFSESFLREAPLRETIARLVPAERFDELDVPLTVTAVDSRNGQLVLFGAGGRERVPLVDALYASCALSVYYPAGRIGDRLYVDGGLRSVLPLDVAALFEPELLFAVNVGPSLYEEPADRKAALPPLVRTHGNALRIMMAAQIEREIARWTGEAASRNGGPRVVIVRPVMEGEATFAVDRVGYYVEEGYRAAVRALSWDGPAA